MSADCILLTSVTGGTGAVTTTRQTGWAAPVDVWTGVRVLPYNYNEYAGTSRATAPIKHEAGICSFDTATGIMTRVKIDVTWDGTNYLPLFGSATAPSALSFGTTAANIDIMIGANSHRWPGIAPFKMGSIANVSDGVGMTGRCVMPVGNINVTLSSGTTYYFPIEIAHVGPFSQAAMRLATAVASGTPTVNVGIYEVGTNGFAGKKLVDFGNLGSLLATGTLQNAAIAVPVDVGVGVVWIGVLYVANGATGSPVFRAASQISGPAGVLLAVAGAYAGLLTVTGQTTLNDPATAATGATSSTSSIPIIAFL